MSRWYQRFAEVFDLPLPLPTAEERFRKVLQEAANANLTGTAEDELVRIVVTPPA